MPTREVMPNWCANRFTVTGETERLGVFIEEIAGRNADGKPVPLCFEKVMPTPDEFPRESERADRATEDWFDWRISHWGTKWEPYADTFKVERDGCDGTFRLSFWTAWAPPIPVVDELARRFPDLEFALLYSESDGGWFAGYSTWTTGGPSEATETSDTEDAIALLTEHEWNAELRDWTDQGD